MSKLPVEKPQWMPIGEAPKDGSDVLIFVPQTGEQFLAYWKKGAWYFGYIHKLKDTPTHWMHLPEPPE